jgi:hypothetical protein
MADRHCPARSGADRKPQIVAADQGGWISGPSADISYQNAADVWTGDILVIDGIYAEVTGVARADMWLDDEFADGVMITWRQRGGTASGVLRRRPGAMLPYVGRETGDSRDAQ